MSERKYKATVRRHDGAPFGPYRLTFRTSTRFATPEEAEAWAQGVLSILGEGDFVYTIEETE